MCGGTRKQRVGSIPACAGEPGEGGRCGRLAHGLSPRVRGNPFPVDFATGQPADCYGSIPACAGELVYPPGGIDIAGGRVYPRVCGGTLLPPVCRMLRVGSIPACAGEPLRPNPAQPPHGSIPACAGEPTGWHTRGLSPRVRANHARFGMEGLSPRVRGNLGDNAFVGACTGEILGRGSIPACAGEPLPPRNEIIAWRVYPRVCGGTRLLPIPGVELSFRRWRGVYPRVCGGTWRFRPDYPRVCVPIDVGLSPRVRGNQDNRPGERSGCSLIPRLRDAGNASVRVYPRVCGGTSCCLRWVYPRVCGGIPWPIAVYPRVCGGTFPIRWSILAHRRSIPACAGEPP